MLDFSLAQLYGVETKYVNRAVKRNPDRFPHDFYFALTGEEESNLKCQFGTSSSWGGRRRSRPFGKHNDEIASLFEAIKQLMLPIPAKKKNRIGF